MSGGGLVGEADMHNGVVRDLVGHRRNAWIFFKSVLGSPTYICAPMVRGSERAFRKLVRKYGVDLCYMPMIRAKEFVDGVQDEVAVFDVSRDENERVVAQVVGRDPVTILRAAKLMENSVSAIDINFGCPQACAEKGKWGAFLLNEPDLMVKIVSYVASSLRVPLFCKIRILSSAKDTIKLCKRLEYAGCQLLAVHGRLVGAKHDGEVAMDVISSIKSSIGIPVIANGAIASKEYALHVKAEYGVDAVMLASGLLENHRMVICDVPPCPIDLAVEYLDYTFKYPPPNPRYLQVHLRWIFRQIRKTCPDQYMRFGCTINQNYMRTSWQFLCLIRLMAFELFQKTVDLTKYGNEILADFKSIRRGYVEKTLPDEETWNLFPDFEY
mmetsp:Transcript_20538/g.33921  ORF Transcript_20538/g.33921 Transcript_20538/m.33921 type:complete len:383 (-) Transcript_20538:355-1503(-)